MKEIEELSEEDRSFYTFEPQSARVNIFASGTTSFLTSRKTKNVYLKTEE